MKILVLAGGFDQIALINGLKQRGHNVILADYYENPPAKQYADKHYQISTLDVGAIMELAQNEMVDIITTACTDQALLTVAYVSEKLGLPTYIDYDTALKVTNKEYMKQRMIEYGIPTARSIVLKELREVKEIDWKFPMVVKPADCNSSKGVLRVKNAKELIEAVEIALQLSRSHTSIVEEYIDGREISVDAWSDSNGAQILSISCSEKMKATDGFTIYQSRYPISLSSDARKKIEIIVNDICKAFSLNNCPILVQAMVVNDEVYVIEFSARMGGGSKYKLIEYMSGVPIMELYIDRILGNRSQQVKPIKSQKYLELNYVYAYEGIYTKLYNFDKYMKTYDIKELFVYKTEGTKIDNHTTSGDRVLGFLIEADSVEELKQLRKKIIEDTDIIGEHGESIMYKECFDNK